jgi:hypothetical protein
MHGYNTSSEDWRWAKKWGAKNVQHPEFAGRHRPNYYSSVSWLNYRGADGTRCFSGTMTVRARSGLFFIYIPLKLRCEFR